MRAIKRKMAYATNDGKIFATKREAEWHVEGLVKNLSGFRYRLKRLATEQKHDKKLLAMTWCEVWSDRNGNRYRLTNVAGMYQRRIQTRRDEITSLHRMSEEIKTKLRGGKK